MNQKANVSKELHARHRKVSLLLFILLIQSQSSILFSVIWLKDLVFFLFFSCFVGMKFLALLLVEFEAEHD